MRNRRTETPKKKKGKNCVAVQISIATNQIWLGE